MPEPEAAADVAIPPTPPLETSSSRASFTSCPPEEERESHAPRAARTEAPLARSPGTSSAIDEDGDARITDVRQEPTPEPDVRGGAQVDREEKGEHVEDAGMSIGAEARSAVASPELNDRVEGKERIAQQDREILVGQSEQVTGDGDSAPVYMSYPPLQREKVRSRELCQMPRGRAANS